MKLKTTLTALLLGTLVTGALQAEDNDRRPHEHDGERDRRERPERPEHDEVDWEQFQQMVKRIMEKHPDMTREQAVKLARKYVARIKAGHEDRHEARGERREHRTERREERGERREGAREEGQERHHRDRFKALVKRLHEKYPDKTREELIAMARRHIAAHKGGDSEKDEGQAQRRSRRDRMHALAEELREKGFDREQIRERLRSEFGERRKGEGEGDRRPRED